ncbi:hypothetical protein SISSUDRAFT_1121095 [Sistotremastrum suecicum HHB10207 ss-3]|uniref:VHS domain-containing protein n=1 Tax=Sistotremastrum suecicum HHB10207 ss-3 TaxID=1314776 RepID=A0A166BDI3_9AGAM|nr:hypothetical protein SISSUDRAFT_1121095 [Sistotremastrum suecicum HHB10207 ss-3]
MRKLFSRGKERERALVKPTPLAPPENLSVPARTVNSLSPEPPVNIARRTDSHDQEREPWVIVSENKSGRPKDRDDSRRRGSEDASAHIRPQLDSRSSSRISLSPEPDKERKGFYVIKKPVNTQATASIVRSLEQDEPRVGRSATRFGRKNHGDENKLDKDKERPKEKEKRKGGWGIANHEDRKSQRRDKEQESLKGREGDQAEKENVRSLIGWWSAKSSEDWSVALHICEVASASEANAKEAAKALRKTLKWGDPGPQLSAARLWAIMLRNPSPLFLAEATSSKFLSAVEDVVTKSTTTPVVKSRVLEVLAGAAYAYPGSSQGGNVLGALTRDKDSGYGTLWRKLKPPGAPDEGLPFDTSDSMFNPPTPTVTQNAEPDSYPIPAKPSREEHRRRSVEMPTRPAATRRDISRLSNHGLVPRHEDIRRIFEECEMAKVNAQVLGEALAFARPEDLKSECVPEFHQKCVASQVFLHAQIPWATAEASKSREDAQQRHAAQLSLSAGEFEDSLEETVEEKLLAAILSANEDLAGAFRIYDELQRLEEEQEMERAVQERSRHETRIDRTTLRYMEDEGSLQPYDGRPISGPSRSPSPQPPSSLPNSTSSLSQSSHSYIPSQYPSLANPFPQTTQPPSSYPLQHQLSHASATLAPPPPAPYGPRKPISPAPSRSPSPDSRSLAKQSLRSETQGPRDWSTTTVSASHDESNDPGSAEETTVSKPSAKSLGKRKIASNDGFDPDDIFKTHQETQESVSRSSSLSSHSLDNPDMQSRWRHPPIHYVYDAAAERAQQMKHLVDLNGVH